MFKKFLFGFFVIFLFVIGLINPALAENFYIDNYDVDIVVDKDKSAAVTENIDVVFTKSSHGIFRDIPLKDATITNVDVSENFLPTYYSSIVKLKIGSANKLIKGNHHYTIKYNYNYRDNKNEFHHNIIGTDWAVDINKASFSITLPEAIKPENIGISIGKYGVKGFDGDAVYEVKDNKITGTTKRKLNPYEGINIRAVVPEDYFNKHIENTSNTDNNIEEENNDKKTEKQIDIKNKKFAKTTIYHMLFFTFISFLIWFFFGRDEKPIPVINFNVPEGLNAMEIELAYNGKCTGKGIVGLIIELAQKGYIKINEDKHQWSIELLKEYDGTNETERDLLKILFRQTYTKTVSQRQLENSEYFYKQCLRIIDNVNKSKNKIFTPSSIEFWLKIVMWFCLFSIVVFTFGFIISVSPLSILYFLIIVIPSSICILLLIDFILGLKRRGSIFEKIYLIISKGVAIFIIMYMLYMLLLQGMYNNWLSALKIENTGNVWLNILIAIWNTSITLWNSIPIINKWVLFAGIICLTIAGICTYHLPKRNKAGQEVYNNLLGLKQFIEFAEKNRLKQLVEEDSQYFYKILPAAYILGVSDKWINKFESIISFNPEWYSTDNFNSNTFSSFTRSAINLSLPSLANGGIKPDSGNCGSSFSSSSGGGGHSGGGGGGGGGSSW